MTSPPVDCEELYKSNQLCIALNEMMLLIGSTLDPEEIMRQIIVVTARAIGCESARIALRSNNRWRIQYLYNLPDDLKRRSFTDEELPHAALAMITKKPVAIEDAYNDTKTNTDIMRELGIRSVLVLPLLMKDEVIGALFFNYHSNTVMFDQAEIDYAEKVSAAVAVALQNASQYQAQERIRKDLEEAGRLSDALNRIESSIYSFHDTDQIMRDVLQKASSAIGAETAMIFSREGKGWLVRYVYKLSQSLIGRSFTDEEVKHTAITARTKEPLAIAEVRNDTRVNRQFVNMLRVSSLLDFPLLVKGEVIGDLVFHYHSKPTLFREHQIDFVRKLQNSISLALENARLFEALKQNEHFKQAVLDSLLAHIAVIDQDGRVIAVNRRWREFAEANGQPDPTKVGLGVNYLDICRKASEEEDYLAKEAMEGIKAVLAGERSGFTLEYPCFSPEEARWFMMNVAPYTNDVTGAVVTHLDITARKRMEEELRQSTDFSEATRAKLEAIIENMTDGLMVFDREGTVHEFNPAAQRLHGFSSLQEAQRNLKNYPEFFRVSDLTGARLPLEEWPISRAMQGEVFKNHEIAITSRQTGKTFIGSYSGGPIRDGRGTIILGLLTIRDVTEEKLAEEGLRKSEQKFTSFFHSVPALIGISTLKEGRFIDANETALKTLGYRREEVVGRTSEELGLWGDRLDRSKIVQMLEEKGSAKNVEVTVKGKTGQVLIGLFSAELIELDGEPCMISLVKDITERKKAEEHLMRAKEEWEHTFNSVPDLIAILDEQHRIIRVNRAMAERIGRQPEECMGLPCYTVIHQTDEVPAFCPHAQTLVDGLEHHQELRETSLGGDFFVSTTPLIGADGKPHGAVHVARDISEEKRAAEQIEILNTNLSARAAELEAANQELEAFNYTVAHDLRNPLNIVSGNCQLIKMHCGSRIEDKCNGYLQQAYEGTLRMNRLISDLLDFSRMARIDVHKEKFDLSAMAHGVAEELTLSDPGRFVDFKIQDGLEIDGDPALMRVVLDNLMGNAWKYTAMRDTARIEFGMIETKGSAAYFVRDNGLGFDMADYARLFAPFQRLPGAEQFKGVGIGLATVARIVNRHGGRVWAEGKPGKGATFYFTL